MKAFAFIPARYQSSRFPGKPLALISGKPMIQRVYDRALKCPELSEVYVCTDDERILECVQGFGGKGVMTLGEHRSGTDRICEAAITKGIAENDIIINVQGDQPLFHPSIVTKLLDVFHKDESIQMATLKCRIDDKEDINNPNHVKVVTDNQGFALYFSRHPIPFFRELNSNSAHYKHLGFYAFRMDFLAQFTQLSEGFLESAEKLEQLRVLEHGFKIKVVETSFNSLEVDVPQDIEIVEEALNGQKNEVGNKTSYDG